MTKQEALEIIKLLSALESWSFAEGKRCPDYLYDQLASALEVLEKEVLEMIPTNKPRFVELE